MRTVYPPAHCCCGSHRSAWRWQWAVRTSSCRRTGGERWIFALALSFTPSLLVTAFFFLQRLLSLLPFLSLPLPSFVQPFDSPSCPLPFFLHQPSSSGAISPSIPSTLTSRFPHSNAILAFVLLSLSLSHNLTHTHTLIECTQSRDTLETLSDCILAHYILHWPLRGKFHGLTCLYG